MEAVVGYGEVGPSCAGFRQKARGPPELQRPAYGGDDEAGGD
jgi:hypothetical protein